MTWLKNSFFVVPNVARDLIPSIGHTAAAVYLCLACRADRDGRCWPAIGTVAKDAGITRRPAQVALGKLVEFGLIEVVPATTPKGAKKANTYQLLIPQPEGAATSACAAESTGEALLEAHGGRCQQHGGDAATSAYVCAASSAQTNNTVESTPSESTPAKKTKVMRTFSAVDHELALLFHGHVKTLDPGAKAPIAKDIDVIRLLQTSDKRSPEEIRSVIAWLALPTCWWRAKVVTFKKLKDNFQTLIVQSKETSNGKPHRDLSGQQYTERPLEGFDGPV